MSRTEDAKTNRQARVNYAEKRQKMVVEQLQSRGIIDSRVLTAMNSVPRENFLPEALKEYAYDDVALPIEEQQTISQPYIVALMAEALRLTPADRVLEVGTGSGYAAAVLSLLAKEVYSIERHSRLAQGARAKLEALGYSNVRIHVGDGTLGWPEYAPYSAISVAAGGESVPRALLMQLAPDGRLVIPVGPSLGQLLLRITKDETGAYQEEALGTVRFVPLKQGLPKQISASYHLNDAVEGVSKLSARPKFRSLLQASTEAISGIEHCKLTPLLERTESARILMLGESTHGTAEFYRMRARISHELFARGRARTLALELDWPNACALDRYIRGETSPTPPLPFSRFPEWVWGNKEFKTFLRRLRELNLNREPREHVRIYGIDLYSLSSSAAAVIKYLDGLDHEAAEATRNRYSCLSPWERDPLSYGRAVVSGAYRSCETAVQEIVTELLSRQIEWESRDENAYLGALQNARAVCSAEAYYRMLYNEGSDAWNHRDRHMFETLRSLPAIKLEEKQVVVWAHNSHIGNAAATEMGRRGEVNLGQLCRAEFGDSAYLIGFGTHVGTVAAAADWGQEVQLMELRPSIRGSYERLFSGSSKDAFFLPLREPKHQELREALGKMRLQRAVGVVYKPETERDSHYFDSELPKQFDEYIWFSSTSAVTPLKTTQRSRFKGDTYPTGL